MQAGQNIECNIVCYIVMLYSYIVMKYNYIYIYEIIIDYSHHGVDMAISKKSH